MNYKNRNVLTLAYMGDGAYEMFIREYLVNKGIERVQELQKEATKYVSARGQARYLHELIDKELLTEEELDIVYRARNHKGTSHPKNTDIITYKYATGLEALIGYLYLANNQARINDIMNYIVGSNDI